MISWDFLSLINLKKLKKKEIRMIGRRQEWKRNIIPWDFLFLIHRQDPPSKPRRKKDPARQAV